MFTNSEVERALLLVTENGFSTIDYDLKIVLFSATWESPLVKERFRHAEERYLKRQFNEYMARIAFNRVEEVGTMRLSNQEKESLRYGLKHKVNLPGGKVFTQEAINFAQVRYSLGLMGKIRRNYPL